MSEESWWQRQTRLYGHDQSKWWGTMPITERVDMVAAVIEGGSIPVYSSGGVLAGRGAPISEVIDCIGVLLNSPAILAWFEDLSKSPSDQRVIKEHGFRGWFLQRGYI